MKIAIRADACAQIGGGHVMRCLALALAAKKAGHSVMFVCADVPGHLGGKIEACGFDVKYLQVETTSQAPRSVETWYAMPINEDAQKFHLSVQGDAPDWVVLDHYGLGGRWVQALRKLQPQPRVMCFDDLECEPLYADLLLDQMALDATPRKYPAAAVLNGPHYALLRPDFAETRAKLHRNFDGVEKVLILPGMIDTQHFAVVALEALRRFPHLKAEVIMGKDSPSCARVRELVASCENWSLSLDVTDMAARMAAADVCIGAGGGTALERCAMGLPSVLVPLSDNQQPMIHTLDQAGAAIAVPCQALSEPALIAEALARLISQHRAYSERASEICDGLGASRVVAAMSGTLRHVAISDAGNLFAWRNSPHIRTASLSQSPLIWEDHLRYVEKISQRAGDGIWMVYSEDNRDLGHVSAVKTAANEWRWSFYIGAEQSPRGAGRRMLALFLRHMLARTDFERLTAQVLPSNERSLLLHDALGFDVTAQKTNIVEFQVDRWYLHKMFGII